MGGSGQKIIRPSRRIATDAILFIAVFTCPPWLVFLIGVFGIFYYNNFYEILGAGIAIDTIYALPYGFFATSALYTFLAVFLFLAGAFLKQHLKFYS